MMSSLETSSPVSASTLAYLMRWPVFLLIWLKLIFSESEVAGYKATGQVTSERRKKPFQLARGAIEILQILQNPDSRRSWLVGSDNQSGVFHWRHTIPSGLPKRTFSEQMPRCSFQQSAVRSNICAAKSTGSAEKFATSSGRAFLQSPRKSCWPGCKPRSMNCAQSATGWWANVASSNAPRADCGGKLSVLG